MVNINGRGPGGLEEALRNAQTMEERANIIKDPKYARSLASETTFTRRQDGTYAEQGASGPWRGYVQLNSDTERPYMD
jgi:hypothetical protein